MLGCGRNLNGMKILTLNTWQERGPWRLRWKLIVGGIQEMRPDVVAFQELFNPDWAQGLKQEMDFPFLVFHPEPSGLAIFSRFEVLRSAALVMKTKSPTEDYLRYALFAKMKYGRRELAVFNTHLSWRLEEGAIREKQVDELLAFMEDKASGHDTVVTGDFNAPPETAEIKKMGARHFKDAFGMCHPRELGFTWNHENPYARNCEHPMPNRRIDYLFVRAGAESFLSRPESVKIIFNRPDFSGIWPSDHFGLLAHFEDANR